MPRIVSVWLERWPIRRLLIAQSRSPDCAEPVDPGQPLVLSIDAPGGPRIAALNEAAEEAGLAAGEHLADARSKVRFLQVRALDAAADRAALERLALWATRYTPSVAIWGEDNGSDGLFLDVTGATHLCGGEAGLLADLERRLAGFGLAVRLALADTPGAGWALARFGPSPALVPSGEEAAALRDLPVQALRLDQAARTTLRRLGLKRIGDCLDKPRASLGRRFGAGLLCRIDQALGRAPEPIDPLSPPPAYGAARLLLEPIATQDAIVVTATALMAELVPALAQDDRGVRSFRLGLYRVDGAVTKLDFGLAQPTRDVAHVRRLIRLRLDHLAESIDAGFGFEAVRFSVTAAERLADRQTAFGASVGDAGGEPARLADVLRQKLGPRGVRRLWPVKSYIPERAVRAGIGDEAPAWPRDEAPLRPPLLLPKAEPADDVVAVVPDGPPQRFRWRRTLHRVRHAQGPERFAPEWWRARHHLPTRDYYIVEDEAGRRFWLFREGLYGRDARSRWFVHGLFP